MANFKIWCETREERDNVLFALQMDEIQPHRQPFDVTLLKWCPVALIVLNGEIYFGIDREDYDLTELPERTVSEILEE